MHTGHGSCFGHSDSRVVTYINISKRQVLLLYWAFLGQFLSTRTEFWYCLQMEYGYLSLWHANLMWENWTCIIQCIHVILCKLYSNACSSFTFFIIYELDFVEDIWFVKINNKIVVLQNNQLVDFCVSCLPYLKAHLLLSFLNSYLNINSKQIKLGLKIHCMGTVVNPRQ